MSLKRGDNFAEKRQHLAKLSDQELKDRFWALTEQIVEPLLELARTHTSPSVERSVLLRMGFNSLDAKAIVSKVIETDLIGKGAGQVVLKVAEKEGISIQEAGKSIALNKYSEMELKGLFTGVIVNEA